MDKNLITKLVFISGCLALVGCIGACAFFAPFTDATHLASTYGIADSSKAALVIENRTTDFFITRIVLKSDTASQELDVLIPMGERDVQAIEPGSYTMVITYSDYPSEEAIPSFGWYITSTRSSEFTITKGKAAIYYLEGGDDSGIFYTPPNLVVK